MREQRRVDQRGSSAVLIAVRAVCRQQLTERQHELMEVGRDGRRVAADRVERRLDLGSSRAPGRPVEKTNVKWNPQVDDTARSIPVHHRGVLISVG